jgi:hypothetical protein
VRCCCSDHPAWYAAGAQGPHVMCWCAVGVRNLKHAASETSGKRVAWECHGHHDMDHCMPCHGHGPVLGVIPASSRPWPRTPRSCQQAQARPRRRWRPVCYPCLCCPLPLVNGCWSCQVAGRTAGGIKTPAKPRMQPRRKRACFWPGEAHSKPRMQPRHVGSRLTQAGQVKPVLSPACSQGMCAVVVPACPGMPGATALTNQL